MRPKNCALICRTEGLSDQKMPDACASGYPFGRNWHHTALAKFPRAKYERESFEFWERIGIKIYLNRTFFIGVLEFNGKFLTFSDSCGQFWAFWTISYSFRLLRTISNNICTFRNNFGQFWSSDSTYQTESMSTSVSFMSYLCIRFGVCSRLQEAKWFNGK